MTLSTLRTKCCLLCGGFISCWEYHWNRCLICPRCARLAEKAIPRRRA